MSSDNGSQSQLSTVAKRILALLSPDWIPLAADVYRTVQALFNHEKHDGLYEVQEYDSTLELVDPKGEAARFKKHHRVKYLQDNVIAYPDFAWGDGEILADYRCSPGAVVDRYQEGNRWNVLISVRETKSSGDIQDFYIERGIKGGFKKSEEWWQIAMQNKTKWLKLSIIFPKQRHCRRAWLVERTTNHTIYLGPEHFANLPDGRQVLTWENEKPRRFETYTFKWLW